MIREELERYDMPYFDNEDGTFVVYNARVENRVRVDLTDKVEVREDDDYYYLDLRAGDGEALYSKKDWNLFKAIENYCR